MAEQSPLFPAALPGRISQRLGDYAYAAGDLSVPELLAHAEAHLEAIRAAHRAHAAVNLRLAEAICAAIRSVVADWKTLSPIARHWLQAAMYYFVHSNDDQHDVASRAGLQDDADVLNACLRLAGREDLCVRVEERGEA